jgi:hypothetical protein
LLDPVRAESGHSLQARAIHSETLKEDIYVSLKRGFSLQCRKAAPSP